MIKKRIGITGAAGVIGQIIQQGLSDRFELVLFDQKTMVAGQGQQFVQIDCSQREAIKGLFNGLDVLIHLAGDPRPNAPYQSTYTNNFMATSFVFDEAHCAKVPKIIFASSNFYHEEDISTALRHPGEVLITLDRPPTPRCLYGESKVFGEQVGRHLSHLGMQFVALRIGWAVAKDTPVWHDSPYMRAMFCSHKDLTQAFTRAVEIETGWLAAYAVSRNGNGVFDLMETEEKLGFSPIDDAENYFR